MRNIRNVLRHELTGLYCEVVDSRNSSCIGIRGVITDETLNTFVVGGKRVFKKGATFRITLGDKKVDISGDHLAARPEDRIKKRIKKW